jgi:hypothetical protein
MVTAPLGVIQHQLNLTGQNVLTFASWALTLVLLGVTIRLGRRERTPFYVLIVVASMVGAFAEALYDEAFSLYFYSTHGMQSFYSAFDVPQPIWTHSGYAVLYALPAVLITYRIRNGGLAPRALYAWAGAEFGMSCVFEMTGINIGTYTYWDHTCSASFSTRSLSACSKPPRRSASRSRHRSCVSGRRALGVCSGCSSCSP